MSEHTPEGPSKKKPFVLIGGITIAIVGLLIAVSLFGPDEPPVTPNSKLAVGYSRLRISLPVFVAQEKGMFDKHGLEVELQMYDTAQPLMQALIADEVQVAGYTALPITFNGMIRSKRQLLFLTTMVEDQNHPISYLLRPATPEGEEPRLNSIEDLRGKTIGILPTIAYKAWLEAILEANGLDPSTDVVIQQIAPNLQPQTLKSGGVDALFTNDPAATSAIALGIAEPLVDEVLCSKFIKDPFPFGSFNVSQEWADQNPELFKRLVAALNEAVDFVNANPDAAKEAMRPYLPDSFQPHVELYPDALYLRTDQTTSAMYEEIAGIYKDIGIIPEQIDLSGLVPQEEQQ